MNKIYVILLFFYNLINAFNFFPNKMNIVKVSQFNKIFMDYNKYKNYDDKLNLLPSFQTSIIINNWMDYITLSDENDNQKNIPDYISKAIYDFKIFIAINREKSNAVYFAWCPQDNSMNKEEKKIVYLIGGLFENDNLHIHRICQNPYKNDMISVKSIDLYNEFYNFYKVNNINISYTELHNYDIRYKLSWNFNNMDD